MFGFGRRKSHRQLAKAELNQSMGHLWQAANHTAGGIGATVGPRVEAARVRVAPATERVRRGAATGLLAASSALTPFAVATANGARQAGSKARGAKAKARKVTGKASTPKRSRRRWPLMLAAGLAVGAATASALRRRREREQWETYDPQTALETARSGELPAADTAPLDQPLREQARQANAAVGEQFTTKTGTMTEETRTTGPGNAVRPEGAIGNSNPPGSTGRH